MEDGIYRAKPVQADLSYTSSGTEQVSIYFELLDAGYEGRYLSYYGSFSERAMEHTFKALRTCGWKGTDLADLSGLDADEVSLVCANEEYNGRTQFKVKWVNAPGGVTVKAPLPVDAAKAFAAKMRGQLLAYDKSAAGATPAKPKQAPAKNGAPAKQQAAEPPPPGDSDRPPF